MSNIIEIKNITKEFKVLNRREGLKGSLKDLFSRDYKIVRAVDNISMSIKQGEIVGYLGPNGAGKSTTIKMMTGILEPTSGEILVGGNAPYQNRTKNAQEIGVVFGQRSQLWWALPLIESFKILKDIYGVSDEDYNNMLTLYKSLVDIEPLLHKPVRQMSLGQRTLSDILAAFLHNPKIVFLDEPTIGLDVSMKAKIRTLIHALNKEKNTTVILTTHDMGDVDALCERIVIIDKGKMLYDNDIDHLKKFFGSYRTLKIRIDGDLKHQAEKIQHELFGFSVYADDEWISILVDEEKSKVVEVLSQLQQSYEIRDMQLEEISTEEVIKKSMRRACNEAEKYLTLTRAGIIESLQFRLGTLVIIAGNLLYLIVVFFLWKAIYASAGMDVVNGMTFSDTLIYLVLATALFNFMEMYVVWDMGRSIQSGKITLDLLKPIEYRKYMFWSLSGSFVTQFFFTFLPTFIVVAIVTHGAIHFGINLLFL